MPARRKETIKRKLVRSGVKPKIADKMAGKAAYRARKAASRTKKAK